MTPGITLYVVRHGETDWNAARKLQGQTDIPLNDLGRGQAARNGQTLRAVLAAHPGLEFWASPLGRTAETMEIVRRELGLPVKGYSCDDRLKEIRHGIWEGRNWDDVDTFVNAKGERRGDDPYHWQPEDGESYAQLTGRVGSWLSTITRSSVVVTHGGVTRALRRLILDVPTADITTLHAPQDKILVLQTGSLQADLSAASSWL
jgi:broad specificity phosphatase PhoE